MPRPNFFLFLCLVVAFFAATVETVHAQMTRCAPQNQADVRVIVTTAPVKTDNSKSVAQLQNFKIDTINPYGADALTEVGGLMSGGLNMKTNVEVAWETDQRNACFWYKTVNVTMHIDPTIFIANTYRPGTCKYMAILEHEKKHIMADRAVATDWRPKLEAYLQRQVTRVGILGPYPANSATAVRARMNETIAKAMEVIGKPLNDDRMKRQQAIDNRAEYERVNNLCKDINAELQKINAVRATLQK